MPKITLTLSSKSDLKILKDILTHNLGLISIKKQIIRERILKHFV